MVDLPRSILCNLPQLTAEDVSNWMKRSSVLETMHLCKVTSFKNSGSSTVPMVNKISLVLLTIGLSHRIAAVTNAPAHRGQRAV